LNGANKIYQNYFFLVIVPIIWFIVTLLVFFIYNLAFRPNRHLVKIIILAIGIAFTSFPINYIVLDLDKWYFYIILIFNQLLITSCYIGLHSGIEIVSPTMYLLLTLEKEKNISKENASILLNSISKERLNRLSNSFLTTKSNNFYQVSKVGKLILRFLLLLDNI
jgi:hypothetical protein